MKAKWVFNSIELLNCDFGFNFNWAHISCSIPTDDDKGSIFSATISVRIPDDLSSIKEIKAYALDYARKYLMICAETDSYSPPLSEC